MRLTVAVAALSLAALLVADLMTSGGSVTVMLLGLLVG